jgi:hypothetical protein
LYVPTLVQRTITDIFLDPAKVPAKNAAKVSAKASGKNNAPKTDRDKFVLLTTEEMPRPIAAWADALAKVDQQVAPMNSDPSSRRYVLPEPAMLVNTSYQGRHNKFLQHWSLVSDGFIYMLTQPEHTQLLSMQEWRDILEGRMTERGPANSKTFQRSSKMAGRIGPALAACNISIANLEGFPAPTDSEPDFNVYQTREIVWQVAEVSFRFEFSVLDKRASGKLRLDAVKNCFAGHMMVTVPLEFSKQGWAATSIEERHRYIGRMATLMLDWRSESRLPDIIRRISYSSTWSPGDMQLLENAVCRYYTQSFWEHFGRAAVVPMHLDHDLPAKD